MHCKIFYWIPIKDYKFKAALKYYKDTCAEDTSIDKLLCLRHKAPHYYVETANSVIEGKGLIIQEKTTIDKKLHNIENLEKKMDQFF